MKLLKIFRVISETAWALSCIAVLCTAFVVIPELWNGVVTGKYFWFFGAQTVFAGFTLLHALLKKGRVSISVLDVFVLVFIAYCSINYLARETGFEIKLYLLLFLGMFYICLKVFIQSITIAKWILPAALITIGLAESVYGLSQLYGLSRSYHGLYKITGHFFNPGPFSGFVALTVPLAVYYVMFYWKRAGTRFHVVNTLFSSKRLTWPERIKNMIWDRENIPLLMVCLSLLNLAAALLVIPATMSRSAWLAIIAGVLIVLAIRFDLWPKGKRFFRKNKSRAVVFMSLSLIIIAVAFAGVYNLKRGSADGRLFLWRVATEAMAKEPVFGAGLGNFAGVYGQTQYDYFSKGIDEKEAMTADCPAYAFNEFLQIGVEQGIIGLLLFLGVVILAIRGCPRDRKKAGVLGAIVAVLVFAFTSYPFSVLPICIALMALLALATEKGKNVKSIYSIIFISLLFAGSLYCIKYEKTLIEIYREKKSLSIIKVSKYNDLTDEYRRLYPYFSRYHDFMFDYGQALSNLNRYKEGNEILIEGASQSSDPMFYNLIGNNYRALKQFDKAEEYYFRAYYTLPNRLYPLYLLSKLYHETGQGEKAKAMAKKLLEKEPKVMSTAVRQMRDYARNLLKQ